MYMTRKVNKEYERLNNCLIELKRLRKETNTQLQHPQCIHTQPHTPKAHELLTDKLNDPNKQHEWRAKLGTAIDDMQHQLNQIRTTHNKET